MANAFPAIGRRAATAIVLLLCLLPVAGPAAYYAIADAPDVHDDSCDGDLACAAWNHARWGGGLTLGGAHALVPPCDPSRPSSPASSPRSLRAPPRL